MIRILKSFKTFLKRSMTLLIVWMVIVGRVSNTSPRIQISLTLEVFSSGTSWSLKNLYCLRGHFFTLSFVAIGLATNFRELAHYFKGGKPLVLYVCGQTFNLGLTLLMAWIMFYKVFPEITASI